MLWRVHDYSSPWEKESTLAKLRTLVYWLKQSKDIKIYIRICLEYAQYGLATKSQLLYPIQVFYLMQLLGIN